MIFRTRSGSALARFLLSFAVTLGVVTVANAQTYLIGINNIGNAIVIEQAKPEYPADQVRRRQEGWVRMHFVVTADGRATDPVIIDSSGGVEFEEAARKAAGEWRFEPPESGAELPNNLANIRTRIRRGKDAPSSEFIRDYRRIVIQVNGQQIENARTLSDETRRKGGWNLYESTLLWLLVGRIEGAEGGAIEKLEAYRRALSIATPLSLGDNDRLGLLGRIFALQDEHHHYADAKRTYARMKKLDESSELVATLAPRAAEIAAMMGSEAILSARATIYNPCNCAEGTPLWYYRPARRTFSFANLSGNVTSFEARCETNRIRGDVEEGPSWTLAPEWGSCRVFVFGEDGASFDFIEHLDDNHDDNAREPAVARSHVLD